MMESVVAPEASGDYRIDALLSGYRWPSSWTQITYSLYDNETFRGTYYGSEVVSEVSEGIKANVRKIMAWYGTIMNLDFVEVTETASKIGYIRFMLSNGPSYAYGYYPSYDTMFGLPGDIHLNPSYDRTGDTNGFQNPPGYHGYMSLAHEVGHTLGLKHPHEAPILPANEDNTSTTIMTYDFKGSSAGTPMPLDHLALHYIYGARSKWTSDDTYMIGRNVDQYALAGTLYFDLSYYVKQTIWDSAGFNTLDLSQAHYNSGGLRLDMRGIGWLTTNAAYHGDGEPYFDFGIAIPEGVIMRDLVNSSSNDTIYANPAPNIFRGYYPSRSTGADVAYGATTADTVDLTNYVQAQVTQSQSGNDLMIGLGSNGSIALKDYYLSADTRPAILFMALPSVSIGDATVIEGDDGFVAVASFEVTLSDSMASGASVAWATADGSASAASGDYAAANGTIIFADGQTVKTVSVTVKGDANVEADETFYVNLTGPSGAVLHDSQGVGTIQNDDQPLPTVSVSDAVPLLEINDGTVNADFTVSLSVAAPGPVSVVWATADGTAKAVSDYVAGSGTLDFAAGERSKTVNVTVNGDTTVEPNETFSVNLSNPIGATIGDGQGIGTITNDDQQPAPSLHIGDLDRSAAVGRKGTWTASVTITVHNASEAAMSNASVSGTWSAGATGTGACTTSRKGAKTCTISKSNLASTTTSVTFSVTGVSLSGYTYTPTANDDPDEPADSDGTTIAISKPLS